MFYVLFVLYCYVLINMCENYNICEASGQLVKKTPQSQNFAISRHQYRHQYIAITIPDCIDLHGTGGTVWSLELSSSHCFYWSRHLVWNFPYYSWWCGNCLCQEALQNRHHCSHGSLNIVHCYDHSKSDL